MKVELVSIRVADLEESMNFYTRIIGFNSIHSLSSQEGLQIQFLKGASGAIIQLIEDEMVPCGDSADSSVAIGLVVDDFDAVLAKIDALGVPIIKGPLIIPGNRLLFIKDPNGVTIEFLEKPVE